MRCRHQEGYIYRKGRSWFVRYYEDVLQDNDSVVRKLVARRLASVSECRNKSDARRLADRFLEPLNRGQVGPSMTIGQFIDQKYLPHVEEQRRPSTATGYREVWTRYLSPRIANCRLGDFRTCNGEEVMHCIAADFDLSRTTLKHIKAFLSGVFKQAKRLGLLDGVNPIQDVSIPKAREPEETYAYSLEEVRRMLHVLAEPAATLVAAAAFTGARRGEIRGFLWENYLGKEITVTQSVWRGHVTEPKTRKSKSPVPVIEPLRARLEGHRAACGNPSTGLMFRSVNGNPLDLESFARRIIRPALRAAGLEWHGWHAFRRGLATNLYQLGVRDKDVQAILRHSNISTTMNSYVKSVPAGAAAAMKALENELCTNHAPATGSGTTLVM